VEVLNIEPQPKHHKGNVHIAVAPTKNIDRMEWCVEKCTEIGVDTITPLLCHYSERKQIRNDRLEKIIISAAKQSLSAYLPQLREMQSFSDCVLSATEQRRYIAHSSPWTDKRDLRDELRKNPDAESTIVLIGAEGGFDDDEVRLAMEHGFIPVSLGDARLRTETAAIVACTYISAYV
jgi:16S rRNA (uracil1498-N3)-methyltransferase